MFIYFWEKETECEWERGREVEGDTEWEAGSRLWAVSTEPDAGLEPTNCEIKTWAEVRHLTNWATPVPQSVQFLIGRVGGHPVGVWIIWQNQPWSWRALSA